MHSDSWKAFWISFLITAAVFAPAVLFTMFWTQAQQEPAASSKNDVPIAEPDAENRVTLLAVVADDPPAFILVRLDAVEKQMKMAVVPGQSAVKNGQQTLTLAESYAAAGPGRAAELLSGTLDISIDRYLAAAPSIWADAIADAGTARVGLSGAMTAELLAQAGMSGEVREWTPSAAHAFLHRMEMADSKAYPPQAVALARAALWQGWARQKQDQLPTVLPNGLRKKSAALLTNFSGTDLLTLGQTLEFLQTGAAVPQSQVLPGTWNQEARRYEFDDGTLAAAQALASTAASSGAYSGSSAP